MDRYQLWFLLVQLMFNLYSPDARVERIDEVLLDAAEDPDLGIDYFALLLRVTDQLLKR